MGGLMRPLRGERPDAHHPGSSLSFTNSWPASGRGTCKNCPGNPSEIKDAGTILDPGRVSGTVLTGAAAGQLFVNLGTIRV